MKFLLLIVLLIPVSSFANSRYASSLTDGVKYWDNGRPPTNFNTGDLPSREAPFEDEVKTMKSIIPVSSGPDILNRVYVPVGSKEFSKETKEIKVTYKPITFGISLPITIENKTKDYISINWRDSYFIDKDGIKQKIITSQTPLGTRFNSADKTVVSPKTITEEMIIPISNIFRSHNQWRSVNLCGDEELPENRIIIRDEDCLGKEFSLVLVYEVMYERMEMKLTYRYDKRFIKE